MILTVSITFLLGTLVSAEPSISSPVVQNVVNVHEPLQYYPLFLNGMSNYIEKPQLLHQFAHLPPQLQVLFDAIEKDKCKESLPLVSPFVVKEFIQEPAKFEEKLKTQDAHFTRIPLYGINDKPLIIAEPPKLPELSVKDLEVLRKKLSDVREKEQPNFTVVAPPAPELAPIEIPQLTTEKVTEPHSTSQFIKEDKPIAIPEPPKLPQLSIEELGRLKEQVPKYEIAREEPEKQFIVENKPVIISEPPKLPEFSVENFEYLKNKMPAYLIERERPKAPSTLVVIPTAPQLSQMIIPELPRYTDAAHLPCEHINDSIELPKFPVVVEEVPAIKPHVSLQLPKEMKPLVVPESPKLPELSFEELKRLRTEVPKYVGVISEVPGKHIEPSISVPKFPVVNEEVPPSEPHVTLPTIPEPPKLPELSFEELGRLRTKVPEYVGVISEVPGKHIESYISVPKFSVVNEEVPPSEPHVILPTIPEPPKLPELSFEQLGRLRTKVPQYVDVISERPGKHIEPSVTVPKFSMVNEEVPSVEPHVTFTTIPEPPKLPQLSIEELGRLKDQVPKYVITKDEPEKHTTIENKPVIVPASPKLPKLTLKKEPEFVIENEQPKSHLTTVVIPPAPQLPKMKFPEVHSIVDKDQIIPQIPCEHPSHLKLGVPLNPHPILMSQLLSGSNLGGVVENIPDKSTHEAHVSNLFLEGAVPYIGPIGLRLHEW